MRCFDVINVYDCGIVLQLVKSGPRIPAWTSRRVEIVLKEKQLPYDYHAGGWKLVCGRPPALAALQRGRRFTRAKDSLKHE